MVAYGPLLVASLLRGDSHQGQLSPGHEGQLGLIGTARYRKGKQTLIDTPIAFSWLSPSHLHLIGPCVPLILPSAPSPLLLRQRLSPCSLDQGLLPSSQADRVSDHGDKHLLQRTFHPLPTVPLSLSQAAPTHFLDVQLTQSPVMAYPFWPYLSWLFSSLSVFRVR
jgi:hypothetical protein